MKGIRSCAGGTKKEVLRRSMESGSHSGGKTVTEEREPLVQFLQLQRLTLERSWTQSLLPINSKADGPSPSKTWSDFVNGTYLPFYRRKWKRSTGSVERGSFYGFTWSPSTVRGSSEVSAETNFKRCWMQRPQAVFPYSVVAHVRWDLPADSLRMAVSEGHILRNPAELLFIPREAKRPEHTSMTMEEVQKCFLVVDQRERLILKFAILAAFGLAKSLFEVGPTCRNPRGHPAAKSTGERSTRPKPSNSVRKAALSAGLMAEIELWRSFSLDARAEAWGVPFRTGKTPLSRDNVWRRRIGPQMESVGLGWVDFHVMRRTHSSLMNEIHDDPKLVADQPRAHS